MDAALITLNGIKFKNNVLICRRVAEEPESRQASVRTNEEHPVLKSVVEIVSPLAELSYEEQLATKMEESKKTTTNLFKQLRFGGIKPTTTESAVLAEVCVASWI